MTTTGASLNQLLNFVPQNGMEAELFNNLDKTVLQEYFDSTKQRWNDSKFYLGGQVLMGLDEIITLEKINQTKEIARQRMIDCPPYNSFEIASVARHDKLFADMETIIKTYIKICNDRVLVTELSNSTVLRKLDKSNIVNIVQFV